MKHTVYPNNHTSSSGFTLVEMIVVLVLFGGIALTATGMFATIQQAQRYGRYQELANASAKSIIEHMRNGQFDALTAGTTRTVNDMVSDELPNKNATVTISNFTPGVDGLKRLDVDIRYTTGSVDRHVYSSAVIGREGVL